MATDYDAPRHNESDAVVEDSLDVLKERHREAQSPAVDVEETDTAEGFELPGADLSGEELSVRVAEQADEFTCSACFLVHHRHRYAGERAGLPICRLCAGLTWHATDSRPASTARPRMFPARCISNQTDTPDIDRVTGGNGRHRLGGCRPSRVGRRPARATAGVRCQGSLRRPGAMADAVLGIPSSRAARSAMATSR
jgi:hypothetical protein